MGQILRNWRVLTATVFSVVLIVGAFLLARGVQSPPIAEASTETALLKAVATKDSDSDGLPDWQEALYGTDPKTVDSNHLGMTDGEAVAKGLIVPKAIADMPATSPAGPTTPGEDGLPPPPADGTLTAEFAKNFFKLYLAAKQAAGGADLTEAQISDVSKQALDTLSATVTTAPDFKSSKDIKSMSSGAEAMKTFAVAAETVLFKNTADGSKTPLEYLKDNLEKGDATAIPHIASYAKMYRTTAAGIAALQVPSELANVDLELVNALMRMSEVVNDFTRVDTDPLTAMLALQQYLDVAQALGKAFIDVGSAYAASGVTLSSSEPGGSFVNMIADIAASQEGVPMPTP